MRWCSKKKARKYYAGVHIAAFEDADVRSLFSRHLEGSVRSRSTWKFVSVRACRAVANTSGVFLSLDLDSVVMCAIIKHARHGWRGGVCTLWGVSGVEGCWLGRREPDCWTIMGGLELCGKAWPIWGWKNGWADTERFFTGWLAHILWGHGARCVDYVHIIFRRAVLQNSLQQQRRKSAQSERNVVMALRMK